MLVWVMRHGTGSGSVRSVWLGGGQMGMNVHVRLSVVHAAEGGRARIKAVGRCKGVLRIQ